MTRLVRTLAHFGSVFLLLVLPGLAGNPYDWMTEMGPAMPPGGIADASGNRLLFSNFLFATIAAVQLGLFFTTGRTAGKWLSACVIFTATALWGMTR
ncbi:hypothetical protein AB4120_18965 [Cupriavidus sp. 2KB_3]|uniref:hypothetical protein n=1 Tax=Cupriavidus TaxID=106589 RepID=UPI0011EC0BD8|nr:hypothetical protein [Cupriavidus campinensis]